MKKNLQYIQYYIMVFLASLVPRILLCLQAVPLRMYSDEVSTINGAALAAGYDWSQAVSNAGYYGFGMSALFGWIFHVFDSPVIIYRVLLIGSSILQSIPGILCLYILTHFFEMKSWWKASLISIAASYMMVTRTTIFYNEHFLILCMWLVFFILLKLLEHNEQKKLRFLWTILLILVMSYSLTIHTRALTFILAFAGVWGIYLLLYKKSLVSIPVTATLLPLGVLASNFLIKLYQNHVWAGVDSVRNTEVNVGNASLSLFLEADTWRAWLGIIFGQLNTVSLISGGIVIASILIIFKMLFSLCRKRYYSKDGLTPERMEMGILIGGIFSGLCMGMTIAAQSITWLSNTLSALEAGIGGAAYGAKAFTYIRYVGPYLGPLFVISLVFFANRPDEFLTHWRKTLKWIVILQVVWLVFILPYCYGSSDASEVYRCFNYFLESEKEGLMVYLPATFVFMLVMLLITYFIRKKKFYSFLCVLVLFLGYQYINNAVNIDISAQKTQYVKVNSLNSLIKEMDGEDILPEEIYVIDTTDKTDHQLYYGYQFYLYDHKVIPDYPDSLVEEAVVFTNSGVVSNQEFLNAGYHFMCLDEDEYICVKGDELWNTLLPHLEAVISQWTEGGMNSMVISGNGIHTKQGFKSDGSEGFFCVGPYLNLESGEYEVKFDIQLISQESESIGYVDISQEKGKILNQYELSNSDFDGTGCASIVLPVRFFAATDIEFRVYAEDGAVLLVTNVQYRRTSQIQHIGNAQEESLKIIRTYMDSIGLDLPMYFLSYYNIEKEYRDFSLIRKALDISDINYIRSVSKFQEDCYILADNRQITDQLFELVPQYIIVCKGDDYTLLLYSSKKNILALEAANIDVLSNNQGIDVRYFSIEDFGQYSLGQEKMSLPAGQYKVELSLEAAVKRDVPVAEFLVTAQYNLDKQILVTELDLDQFNSTIESIEFAQFSGSEPVIVEVRPYMGNSIESKVYIQKISSIPYIDLRTMALGSNTVLNPDGSQTYINGGFQIYGPYQVLAVGKYSAIFIYECEEWNQDLLGITDIAVNGNQKTQMELLASEVVDGKLVIELSFEVTGDGSYEFRTWTTEGTRLKLTSIGLEKK